jgi:hypothetical protein
LRKDRPRARIAARPEDELLEDGLQALVRLERVPRGEVPLERGSLLELPFLAPFAPLDELGHHVLNDGLDELLLRTEVVVEARDVDARPRRDVARA